MSTSREVGTPSARTAPTPIHAGDDAQLDDVVDLHRSNPRAHGRQHRLSPRGYRCPKLSCRRGDDRSHLAAGLDVWEAAPQARGRPADPPHRVALARNSPTGAGTTPCSAGRSASSREQPRRRGDDPTEPKTLVRIVGPAPQARGRPAGVERHPGQTAEQPRRRGDDVRSALSVRITVGTAPQARGRPGFCPCRQQGRGNSPAGAGTTRRPAARPTAQREQPRRRGDDSVPQAVRAPAPGTAPQARGRHRVRDPSGLSVRNSPAGAGTTVAIPGTIDFYDGTAPQARGRLREPAHGRVHHGNSPAGAGTT